jgi:NAD(P)-dependent dehydrogenase (short-subunit alcohol dehydrogenase family)
MPGAIGRPRAGALEAGYRPRRMPESLVFVTGGSSGIGQAMLHSLPFSPARVFDVSRRGAAGYEQLRMDLADPASWPRVADLFRREVNGFAGDRVVFIHCAGTLTPIGFSGEEDAAAYARAVLLNSAAPQVLGDAFLRAARGTRAPCQLLMIGSGAARNVYAGWTSYGAGKAAVDQWVRTAGAEQELRGGRCHVVSVAPGLVETPMQQEIRATPSKRLPDVLRFHEVYEKGELRDPADVAREIWALLERGLPNGAVYDLRNGEFD